MKTEKQLEDEWGIERLVEALRILSEWWEGKKNPISLEQFRDLQTKSQDAFELCQLRIDKLLDELITGEF